MSNTTTSSPEEAALRNCEAIPARRCGMDRNQAPINAVLTEYSRLIQEGKVIVSFVSGDPFFFGFASTIRKNLLGVGMKVFPYFNSLQMFAHHEQIPYENMHAVSVTGRPWHELDRALLEYRPLIGVLTDRIHTPRL